ncbi:hypothetical protein [Pseudorhodoferax sp.]|uniref:hypothetical protein n=1 Tax=Pseudorhodoferax sp. TaxID=1993553 RepID=UPI0039E49D9C
MISRRVLRILTIYIGVTGSNAYALGAVSRSCSMSELNTVLSDTTRTAMLLLFKAISQMSVEEYKKISSEAKTKQALNWWALESVTTDYFADRYFLFAKTKALKLAYESPVSSRDDRWSIILEATSQGWKNESIDPALLNDPILARHVTNRKWLRSARAGHESIFQKISPKNPGLLDNIVVYGQHWYYDPISGFTGHLSDTRAYNCNLLNWGVWDR